MHITIGITNTEAFYQNYPLWIQGGNATIEILKLTKDNTSDLTFCNGIVLSGGVDTHPKFYKSDNIHYPNAPAEFDEKRDQFELDVFHYACENQIPLLAICRGMQLVNIALGGNIIQDIEAIGKNNHQKNGTTDGIHDVSIAIDSLLYRLIGNEKGTVNSAHHQALDIIANDLVVNAWSTDGIAEGIEWKDKIGKPFLIGVQWHPERLGNAQKRNPLSQNIRTAFLEAVEEKREILKAN